MAAIKRPILCYSAINWDFLYQRPQQLMVQFARRGHPVYFRNPSQIAGIPLEEIRPNLWLCKDFDKVPAHVFAEAIYIVYFPFYANWIDKTEKNFFIYDCADDFPDFSVHEPLMLNKSDLVLCASEQIGKKLAGQHSRLVYLPNGVDINHFLIKQPLPEELAEIKQLGEPIVGFTGSAYPQRMDLQTLFYLAASRPQWHFVIVGEQGGADFSGAPSNIRFLGPRPYESLPAYMQCFDIGIIPFQDNQIARGTDPIKIYEYLAAGLPIVSRTLPFAQRFAPPLMYTYNTGDECLDALEQALAEDKNNGDANRNLRLDFARKNSWAGRAEQVLSEINQLSWTEKPV